VRTGQSFIELARRGYEVTGLDWSEIYLDAAKRQAAETGVSVQFLQGDMTNLTFDEQFDAVILWGNTFGEFEHEDNVQTLYGIRRALKKGGRALIDTQNYQGLPDKLTQGWSFDNEDPNLLMLTQGTRDVRSPGWIHVLAINLATGEQRLPYSGGYLLPNSKV
jgi:2-polyprenyl-3-methyl-5-hydroxy-6-metoxy-1,4-benzoquinol methylase